MNRVHNSNSSLDECLMKTLKKTYCVVCKEKIITTVYSRNPKIVSYTCPPKHSDGKNPYIFKGQTLDLTIDSFIQRGTFNVVFMQVRPVSRLLQNSTSLNHRFVGNHVGLNVIEAKITDITKHVLDPRPRTMTQSVEFVVNVLDLNRNPKCSKYTCKNGRDYCACGNNDC